MARTKCTVTKVSCTPFITTESTAAETMVTMICRNVPALEISEAFT